ncbi:hypothetical protein RJ639_000630 [Escallonia herrerae]|uniref:Inositol polyphosphate-related phosphatase domain-containing protein n=1 Tax=Escallonia herrerae TaxID=1293975 RepID=A0AA88XD50_9ASTE|nr:hypothetical protein RJ639_000630 [Escallonia herrerae]
MLRRQQHRSATRRELFWPTLAVRKWLHINSAKDSDFGADTDDDGSDSDVDNEEHCDWPFQVKVSVIMHSLFVAVVHVSRVSVGTWNVGGKLPPDDLEIKDWLDISKPADIYVIGYIFCIFVDLFPFALFLQEIIPLNAGNIFVAEDNRPVPKWENIIRETLNKIQPAKTKFKCYSDPPSPSRFKPSDDIPDIEEEISLETDSEDEEEIYPVNEESDGFNEVKDEPITGNVAFLDAEALAASDNGGSAISSPKRLDRLHCLQAEDCAGNTAAATSVKSRKLTKTLSGTERIGLSWPEPPLDLLAQFVLDRPNPFRPTKSFKNSKSFRTYNSFKSNMNGDNRGQPEAVLLSELDLESVLYRKRRSTYVRMVSKQMVGIFVTVWVRRSLRKHIQNLSVSTVGVGVMGFIGEKDADAIKRNADVHEIHRRTRFLSPSGIGLPKSIHDHEKIIWLGDLNYRINSSYDKTRELISKRDWSSLVESDQLIRELRKGRAFDGWSEGTLTFPPTYKYELNSEKYYGEDPKIGRRTPAWCDRILSFGKGMKLLSYRRTELRLSDHRPVTASYMIEVEVFSSRKLQKALTITDAEIEQEEVLEVFEDTGNDGGSRLRLGQVVAAMVFEGGLSDGFEEDGSDGG